MPELTKDRVRFVRLSAFEDRLLHSVMAHERVNISDALRLGIREAAKSRGLWPENGDRDTDATQEAAA
jgi:hypothetical protein